MKKMIRQELMHFMVVIKWSHGLVKVLGPIEAGVLHLRKEISFYLPLFYLGYKCTRFVGITNNYKSAWSTYAASILLKNFRHKLYAVGSKLFTLFIISKIPISSESTSQDLGMVALGHVAD